MDAYWEKNPELHDIINDAVCGHLAEWGTTAKVDKWDNKENVPLRDILNGQCGPLIKELYQQIEKHLGGPMTINIIDKPLPKVSPQLVAEALGAKPTNITVPQNATLIDLAETYNQVQKEQDAT